MYAVLLTAIHSVFAADTTVVLQNGLDGYTGCKDSYVYISYGIGTVNFGGSEELKVHRESC